jgi:hypothetical protein
MSGEVGRRLQRCNSLMVLLRHSPRPNSLLLNGVNHSAQTGRSSAAAVVFKTRQVSSSDTTWLRVAAISRQPRVPPQHLAHLAVGHKGQVLEVTTGSMVDDKRNSVQTQCANIGT